MPHLLIRADGSLFGVTEVFEGTIEDAVGVWNACGEEIARTVEVSDDKIPPDRSFRSAWRHCDKTGVGHCMDTARAIHKDRIRQRRKERFQETDVAGVQGLVNRRDVSDVLAMVQALKDAPADPRIEQAGSVEELKAIWPEVLEQPVPALGGPVVQGQEGTYDLKGLENWAQGLNEKIARLEAANAGGIQRDLQSIMAKVDEISSNQARRIDALSKQLDFVTERAAGKAVLTTEEVQQ